MVGVANDEPRSRARLAEQMHLGNKGAAVDNGGRGSEPHALPNSLNCRQPADDEKVFIYKQMHEYIRTLSGEW